MRDVFALCCRSRWWGLEQEGFGIVLVEAAAAGVPCVTIGTGGAAEAVVDGETGIVVSDETEVARPSRPGSGPKDAQVSGVADHALQPSCLTLGGHAVWVRRVAAGPRTSCLTTSWPPVSLPRVDQLPAPGGPPARKVLA